MIVTEPYFMTLVSTRHPFTNSSCTEYHENSTTPLVTVKNRKRFFISQVNAKQLKQHSQDRHLYASHNKLIHTSERM
jgi:hypothetical protein